MLEDSTFWSSWPTTQPVSLAPKKQPQLGSWDVPNQFTWPWAWAQETYLLIFQQLRARETFVLPTIMV